MKSNNSHYINRSNSMEVLHQRGLWVPEGGGLMVVVGVVVVVVVGAGISHGT